MFGWLSVLGIPLLPLPGGQRSGDPLSGSALQSFSAEGIVILRLFLTEDFAHALLVTGFSHGETFLFACLSWVRSINKGGLGNSGDSLLNSGFRLA